MTGWQDSRSINRRHEHTVAVTVGGRDICHCGQQIFKPITSSDDPRLETAGFMRSHKETYGEECTPPLPEVLIALHFEGHLYGYANAPIAPYVEMIAREHEKRRYGGGDLWVELSAKTS